MSAIADTLRYLRDHRCFLLMVSLLATLAIAPWLDNLGARAFVAALATSAFVSAVHAVGTRRRDTWIASGLGLATVVFGLIAQTTGSRTWAIPGLSFFAVTGAFTLLRMLVYVVRPGEVTVDKIYAAISVYLLAGFVWGGVYALTEILSPGSFQVSPAALRTPATMMQSFVYLSFVTLVSLGYGDILPVAPHARSLALLEALAGTFYMVVIIARLVAAYGAHPHGLADEEEG